MGGSGASGAGPGRNIGPGEAPPSSPPPIVGEGIVPSGVVTPPPPPPVYPSVVGAAVPPPPPSGSAWAPASAKPPATWNPQPGVGSGPQTPGAWTPQPHAGPPLWRPLDVGLVSLLLGFPAGIALAIDNARREHHRNEVLGLALGFAVATVVVVLVPSVALILSFALAALLWRMTALAAGRWRAMGVAAQRPPLASAVVAIVGGWLAFLLLAFVLVVVLLTSGPPGTKPGANAVPLPTAVVTPTSSPRPSPSPSPHPTPRESPTPSPKPTLAPGATPWPTRPADLYAVHQDPSLEALLPATVLDSKFNFISVRGIVLFRDLYAMDNSAIAQWEDSVAPLGVPINDISYAYDWNLGPEQPRVEAFRIKGVDAASYTEHFGLSAADMFFLYTTEGSFTDITLAGKHVQLGTHQMLGSSYTVTLQPYLYLHGDTAFLIIARDDTWAEAALKQLP